MLRYSDKYLFSIKTVSGFQDSSNKGFAVYYWTRVCSLQWLTFEYKNHFWKFRKLNLRPPTETASAMIKPTCLSLFLLRIWEFKVLLFYIHTQHKPLQQEVGRILQEIHDTQSCTCSNKNMDFIHILQ